MGRGTSNLLYSPRSDLYKKKKGPAPRQYLDTAFTWEDLLPLNELCKASSSIGQRGPRAREPENAAITFATDYESLLDSDGWVISKDDALTAKEEKEGAWYIFGEDDDERKNAQMPKGQLTLFIPQQRIQDLRSPKGTKLITIEGKEISWIEGLSLLKKELSLSKKYGGAHLRP